MHIPKGAKKGHGIWNPEGEGCVRMGPLRREVTFSKEHIQHKTTPQRGSWEIKEYFLSFLTLFLPSDFLLGVSNGQIIGKPE